MNLSYIDISTNCNGPGKRLCLWLQGCDLGCVGCFNPHTHSNSDKTVLSVKNIVSQITRLAELEELRGITLTGGEPLQQAEEVKLLLDHIPPTLDKLVFTGYTLKEVLSDPKRLDVLKGCDAMICGRYMPIHKMPALACKQLVLPTNRIGKEEFSNIFRLEFIIGTQQATITGFPG